ncbi:hypothetical protein TNIN_302761 [Trichonephila inaurata madagascariensis]|uniref:Transmembrane protein n=1 Tax=Trichonephila inaurata madagascariensis TaxID=2747483 RepID=A0A8X6WXG0_9ARAC|nr:hypothetical protein TNIN_302761 [Trichonephila inaurata madagascariensis]
MTFNRCIYMAMILATVALIFVPMAHGGHRHKGYSNYDIMVSGLVAKMLQENGGGGGGHGGFYPIYIPFPVHG